MPKHRIRQQQLSARCCLNAAQRQVYSLEAQQRLLDHPLFAAAQVVALYSPIRCEVDTGLLLKTALDANKRVVYPRVDRDGSSGADMHFVGICSERDFEVGAFGVLEPNGERVVGVSMIDLIVVPGVAFDRSGYRLGYGKGFYDRAVLSRSRGCSLVGLGYAFQVEDVLPHDVHDLMLDWLITDHETLDFSRVDK